MPGADTDIIMLSVIPPVVNIMSDSIHHIYLNILMTS